MREDRKCSTVALKSVMSVYPAVFCQEKKGNRHINLSQYLLNTLIRAITTTFVVVYMLKSWQMSIMSPGLEIPLKTSVRCASNKASSDDVKKFH